MIRRVTKIDSNQPEIVRNLQTLGFFVIDCSAVGQLIPGFPDLLCARRGALHVCEVKTEDGKRTPEQVILHRKLESYGVIVPVLRNFDDVIRFAGARRTA